MDAREQEEIDPSDQARADLEAIKDQIDDDLYTMLIHWLDRGNSEYLRGVREKIEFLNELRRRTWGRVYLPGEEAGGLDEIV